MRPAAIALSLAIASCGGAGPSMLAVEVRTDALFYDPEQIDIRIYGSGASCTTLLDNAESLTAERCAAADVESGTCYIEQLITTFAPRSASEPVLVPIGDRQVLVLGYEDPFGLVGKGCTGVTVREGKTARASILLQDAL